MPEENMVIKCPKCDNEVFRPYTYCSACGWTATEKEIAKMKDLAAKQDSDNSEDLEKKRRLMTKEYLKREKDKGRPVPPKKTSRSDDYEIDDDDFKEIFGDVEEEEEEVKKEEKPKEGIKFPCKCGNMIKVTSPKRPIRISCPKCGASGTLKKDPPNAKKFKIGQEEDAPKKKEGVCPKCGADGKGAKFCPECGEKMPKKEPKPDKPPPPEDETCPKCGADAKGIKFCIECGAKIPQSSGSNDEDRPPGMPTKGKCSQCQSTELKFYPDGRGKCPDCGRKFRWDKKKDAESPPPEPRSPPPADKRPPRCRSCKNRTEWIEEYKRFYCADCNLYV